MDAWSPKKFHRTSQVISPTLPDKSLQICQHPLVLNIPALFIARHHPQSNRTTHRKKKRIHILWMKPFKFGIRKRVELRDFRTINNQTLSKLVTCQLDLRMYYWPSIEEKECEAVSGRETEDKVADATGHLGFKITFQTFEKIKCNQERYFIGLR